MSSQIKFFLFFVVFFGLNVLFIIFLVLNYFTLFLILLILFSFRSCLYVIASVIYTQQIVSYSLQQLMIFVCKCVSVCMYGVCTYRATGVEARG